MKRLFTFFIIASFFINCTPAKINLPVGNNELSVVFHHNINGKSLILGETYTNPFDEPFTPTMFKYYISNISLEKRDGSIEKVAGSYFLINEADSISKSIRIRADANNYKSISFLVGVDSSKNVSGTQTGALDPAKGMFWTWNTGYIMAKLEATSPLSTMFNNKVEYHIGGFKGENNTIRKVRLGFEANAGQVSEIHIEVDLFNWFNGKHELPVKEKAICTTPGNLATKYADNYATMFTIKEVKP